MFCARILTCGLITASRIFLRASSRVALAKARIPAPARSGEHLFVVYYSFLHSLRREFLENHASLDYNALTDEPTKVYIPKDFSQPLLKQVKDDWKLRSYDWAKFMRQSDDLEWGCDDQSRKINSDYRCWLASWFGKDWIFFLWMAFGNVDNMMKCVNDICRKRAALSEGDKDPASTRADVMRLSERNRYIELGITPVPPIKGIQHRRSIPQLARMDVRKREAEYWQWVAEVQVRGWWSDEDNARFNSEWQEA